MFVWQVSGAVDFNQGTGGAGDGNTARQVTPALGLSWANLVTTRILLQRTERYVTIKDEQYCASGSYEANVRTMEVVFAPHLPNTICHFIVDAEGVKGIQSCTS